jgi:hypothetical protein
MSVTVVRLPQTSRPTPTFDAPHRASLAPPRCGNPEPVSGSTCRDLPVGRLVTSVLLAAACSIFAGCGAGQASAKSPAETLSAYASALRDGRVEDAYSMLSDEARKNMPFEAFKTIVQENPEEVREMATALTRPAGPPRVTAVVTSPEGDTLLLVYEAGRWRIDGSAIDLYNQDTPKTALSAFVRAFENKRYDVLMRFVPDSKKEGLSEAKLRKEFEGDQKEEVERLTQALKAALPTAQIELLGDRATMSYGAGGTIELMRERGIWKVEEF